MPHHHRLLHLATLLASVTTLGILILPATAHAACSNAGAAPGSIGAGELRRAVRCIVNEERAQRGLRPVRSGAALGEAARGHARDMVRRGYFAHERGGSTLRSRLREAGWNGDAAGETLAYGCGSLGVPRAIVDAWLGSPGHRDILLSRRYRRAGIGLADGMPHSGGDCPGAGTWVMVFGAP
jgi:uncharacterized protein YkwD